jgi:hypothetical protein
VSREVDSLRRFIFGTIDDLVQSLEGLSEAQLNWRPAAAETNSLCAIVTRCEITGASCGGAWRPRWPRYRPASSIASGRIRGAAC